MNEMLSARVPSRTQVIIKTTLSLVLLCIGAWIIQGFMRALVWSLVLAVALWPTYRRIALRWPGMTRGNLLAVLFTLGAGLVLLTPLVLVAIKVGQDTRVIAAWLLEAGRSGIPVPDWVGRMAVGSQPLSNWWTANLSGHADLLRNLDRFGAVAFGRQLGLQVVHVAVQFGFTLLALFFAFVHGESLIEQCRSVSSMLLSPSGERIGYLAVASVHATLNGLVLVGLGEGFVMGLVYAAAGVSHATLLGAMTAVAAIISFGAPLAFGSAGLMLLAQGSLAGAVVVIGSGFLVLGVADHWIRPMIIGGATRLPFLWVLLGILGGVETLNLLGLFVGPAVMAALMMIWRETVQKSILYAPLNKEAFLPGIVPGSTPQDH